MLKTLIDRQWKLRVMNELTLRMEDADGKSLVDLPHDYSIEQKMDKNTKATASNAYLPGGVLEYEKIIFAPMEWKNKKIILEFEGVYMNAVVRVNSNIVARNPYGYTSFHCDLSPFIQLEADNKITVSVNNSALPNTRWYSGTGIYRHVWLMIGDRVHIEPWGVFATTPQAESDRSVMNIKTRFTSISDIQETVILKQIVQDAQGCEAGSCNLLQKINPGETREIEQTFELSNPRLWSVEDPYLYNLITQIIHNDVVIDNQETKIGIRKISFDAKNGFMLNGVSMKLKGGCVHHDCGLLGSASYDRAEQRKIELLKQSGFNAVRCAHNPPSPAFLDACDSLGMLVIDEAFDCWNEAKMTNDYSNYFKDWWKKDLASMLLRDRNHPSIIMWSTGNEIPERDGRSEGFAYAEKLAAFVRGLDNTRAVTNALCELWGTPPPNIEKDEVDSENPDKWGQVTKRFAAPLDVVGYNYMPYRYENDGHKFPDRIICGTETFPMEAFDYWCKVEQLPHVIGDFVWTGLDYLGEAGIGRVLKDNETSFVGEYPWNQANCGDIDICGFKRPQSYYRDCVWGINQRPFIAVHHADHYGKEAKITRWGWHDVYPCWTWPSHIGKPFKIDVYSADDEVELFINNKSIARKPAGKSNRYIASFETDYEPGELLAIGFKDGKEVSRAALNSADIPDQLCLELDRNELNASFGDLCYVTVTVKDKNGLTVDNADTTVHFTVSGAGSLLAVGSSNPKSDEGYTGNVRKLYYGKAMAVVRSDGNAGTITITAEAEGVKSASVTINSIHI